VQVVVAEGRRIFLLIYASLAMSSSVLFVGPTSAWLEYWAANRASIVMFTAVNTAVTSLSEIGSRTILPAITGHTNESFFVQNPAGVRSIHRQSLINIFMTLFASLLGGPVYFIKRRRSRFLFFFLFGCFNSVLSQGLSSFLRDGIMSIVITRLAFDFFYNGSVKFYMFEYTRPFLLRFRRSYLHVGGIRVTQDFVTTFFRVSMLMLLGLKG
jgi:hypothetical protein